MAEGNAGDERRKGPTCQPPAFGVRQPQELLGLRAPGRCGAQSRVLFRVRRGRRQLRPAPPGLAPGAASEGRAVREHGAREPEGAGGPRPQPQEPRETRSARAAARPAARAARGSRTREEPRPRSPKPRRPQAGRLQLGHWGAGGRCPREGERAPHREQPQRPGRGAAHGAASEPRVSAHLARRAGSPRTLPARASGGRALGAARRPARCHRQSAVSSGPQPKRPPQAAHHAPQRARSSRGLPPSSWRPPLGTPARGSQPGRSELRTGGGEHHRACALARRELFHASQSPPVRTWETREPFLTPAVSA